MNPIQTIREGINDFMVGDMAGLDKALAALDELERTHYAAEDMADAQAKAFRAGVASVTAGQQPVAWLPPINDRWTWSDSVTGYRTEKAGWAPVFAAPVAQQEPVAWLYESPMPDGSVFVGASADRLKIGFGVTPDTKESPLYRAAPVAQQSKSLHQHAKERGLHMPTEYVDDEQPQAHPQRYSPDGKGSMEVDSLGGLVKLRDVKQPQAEAVPPQAAARHCNYNGGTCNRRGCAAECQAMMLCAAKLQQAEAVRWCPDVCPITGMPFFMWIDHPKHGEVPTYGGPYDSYTIPVRHKDGSFCCERYDHDNGWWVTDEVHDVGVQIVSDQAYVSDEAPQQAEAVPPGYVIDSGFRWDGENQQHIPQLTIEFEPVPANGPCDAKGWKDRDVVARMFMAQGAKT